MENNIKYLVYENWQASKKAVVHKSDCSRLKTGNERINEKPNRKNDRWYGHFDSLNEAITLAILIPNREFRICEVCLKHLIDKDN